MSCGKAATAATYGMRFTHNVRTNPKAPLCKGSWRESA